MNWDPSFIERSPILAPLAPYATQLSRNLEWPRLEALQELIDVRRVCNQCGSPIRLVRSSNSEESYEERVYRDGILLMRQSDWHDLFNVLAWLVYPRAKAALNARHVSAFVEERDLGVPADTRGLNKRGRVRDALTLFDESGAFVIATDPELIARLREFRWKALFWDDRMRVMSSMRFYVFGHAAFEKSLSPYSGMTGHALTALTGDDFINASSEQQIARVDELAAKHIHTLTTPRVFAPLPLLGVPGWWPANEQESFYDDTRYFRPGRSRRSGEAI